MREKDFCTGKELHEYIASQTSYFRLIWNLKGVMSPIYLCVFVTLWHCSQEQG